MLHYDLDFDPPAPVASVRVAHPVTGLTSNILRGKLDTGADLTVIPESLLVPLRLSAKGHVWTRSFDGTYSQRPVCYIAVAIEGHKLPTVRCIAADRDTVLVGRNVLNRFVLTLDGRQLMFELQPVWRAAASRTSVVCDAYSGPRLLGFDPQDRHGVGRELVLENGAGELNHSRHRRDFPRFGCGVLIQRTG